MIFNSNFRFDLDPTTRYNWLNVISCGTILFTYQYGANQVQIQRMLTAKLEINF